MPLPRWNLSLVCVDGPVSLQGRIVGTHRRMQRRVNGPPVRNGKKLRRRSGNPLRFIKGEPPPIDELFATKRMGAMNLDKTKSQDIAGTGGAPEQAGE